MVKNPLGKPLGIIDLKTMKPVDDNFDRNLGIVLGVIGFLLSITAIVMVIFYG